MIYKKDDGDGNAFWTAVTANRVILPSRGEAERTACGSTNWYLLDAGDEYWLYSAEGIKSIVYAPGSRLSVHPVGKPYAIYDKSKYTYMLEDGGIEIVEKMDNVSHPSYYAYGWSNGAEVIDLTEHLSFCAGNVVKYVCRAGRKDPDKYVEDLEKARWYLDREIARVKEY